MTASTALRDNHCNDFPILSRHVNDKRLVYLDSAATAHKPSVVLDAMRDFYSTMNANVHRGMYALSEEATQAYECARRTLADFIGADAREIIFVRNATEALNLLARGIEVRRGDTILLTQMEHHSNIVPWHMLAERTGANIDFIPVTAEGLLDMAVARAKIAQKPRILSVTHVSNVLGTINPVRELIHLAHESGALAFVDAAQSVPHMPVNVKELGADALAFSGHKMLGPMGIGVLWARQDLLESLRPQLGGGDTIKEVHESGFAFNDIPHRFEAGTPHVAGAIGLAAAARYLSGRGMSAVRSHEQEITAYALKRLSAIKDMVIYGPKDASRQLGVISFNLGDMHAHDVSTVLDGQGLAVRAGHHCAQPLMEALGVAATCRASFYIYNTKEDVDALVIALEHAREVFRL